MGELVDIEDFARGSVVRRLGTGPNMLVVRGLGLITVVVCCEGEESGTLRMRELPTSDLEQVLATGAAEDALFDLQWKATMRGVEMWRAKNPGNDLVLPDHANLICWLLEQLTTPDVLERE